MAHAALPSIPAVTPLESREPAVAVQYHPEAAPGPHDSFYLFDDFVRMMEEWKKRN